MPWRSVLTELVGYTRGVQSQRPQQQPPPFCPLDAMRAFCAQARQRLQDELDSLESKGQEDLVTLLHNSRKPTPGPGHRDVRLLLQMLKSTVDS